MREAVQLGWHRWMKCLRLPAFLGVTLAPLCGLASSSDGPVCNRPASDVHGAWESADGGARLLFADGQIVIRRNGRIKVATVLRSEGCSLLVRYQGLRAHWTLSAAAGEVILKADETFSLHKLTGSSPDLGIGPVALPAPAP